MARAATPGRMCALLLSAGLQSRARCCVQAKRSGRLKAGTNGSERLGAGVAKTLTGITGFDAITGGGLPRGRTALVCGGAGCGKTLFAMEFIVNGATALGEPGVVIAFE